MATGQCPQCDWAGDTRGLAGHIRFKHGRPPEPPQADASDCVNCKQLESDLRMAQKNLAGARAQRPGRPGRSWRPAPPTAAAQLPSVAEFLAHCESGGDCEHSVDWGQRQGEILKAALDNASDDFLLTQVFARSLIPGKISITIPEENGR
jgi:hypothetical protein